MYYLYVLINEENRSYIGYTKDLKRRFNEHNNSKNQSTKNHIWKLIYY